MTSKVLDELKQRADGEPPNVHASYMLGSLAAEGRVVKKNVPLARHYLERAIHAAGDDGREFRDLSRVAMAKIAADDIKLAGNYREALQRSTDAVRFLEGISNPHLGTLKKSDAARIEIARALYSVVKRPATETDDQTCLRRDVYSAALNILKPFQGTRDPDTLDLMADCAAKVAETSQLVARMWKSAAQVLRTETAPRGEKARGSLLNPRNWFRKTL